MTDSQTIAAYIAAQFATHNADESAHGQSAEAIYNHRIAEILDHLDQSVTEWKIADLAVNENKIIQSKDYFTTMWDTIDAFTSVSSNPSYPELTVGCVRLSTDNVSGHYSSLIAESNYWAVTFETQNPSFEANVWIPSEGNRNIYFGMGRIDECFIGFKVVNATLYACVIVSGVEHNHSLGTTYDGTKHNFMIKFTSNIQADFYIDGENVYTESAYSPDCISSEDLFVFYVKTTTTANRTLYIFRTTFYQDL